METFYKTTGFFLGLLAFLGGLVMSVIKTFQDFEWFYALPLGILLGLFYGTISALLVGFLWPIILIVGFVIYLLTI